MFQIICEFGESMVLILDTRSNMTTKYGTNYFIIKRHYKWEDCELNAVRQADVSLQDLSRSLVETSSNTGVCSCWTVCSDELA